MNKTILIVILIFFVSILTVAASSKLEIDKVEIKSGLTVLESGTSGSFNVKQGQTLSIKIKIENNYAESSDNDIEDLYVSATIKDIDDGDEIQDEIEDTYVRADGYKTVTLELDIPEDADTEQSYNLDIYAEGKDANGTMQSDDVYFELEVKEDTTREEEQQNLEYERELEQARYEQEACYESADAADATTERYYNPNRDLSFLYSGGEQQVVLEMPPQIPRIPTHPAPVHKDSALSIIALALANIAIVVFLGLLIRSLAAK